MNFSQSRADLAQRKLTGLGFVVLFHAALAYALMTGLARKVVEVVRAPIETKVIEEITKPPPPKEIVPPPPPKLEAPPPPFIPPPEVQLQTPPPPAPAITAEVSAAPPATTLAPTPVAPAPAAAPAPAVVSAAVACSNYTKVMGEVGFPRDAMKQGLEKGEALIQFVVGAGGDIKDVKVLRASHPIFARSSARIVSEYKCAGQGHDVLVQVPFGYKLD
jgi:periplasmic protein TonB